MPNSDVCVHAAIFVLIVRQDARARIANCRQQLHAVRASHVVVITWPRCGSSARATCVILKRAVRRVFFFFYIFGRACDHLIVTRETLRIKLSNTCTYQITGDIWDNIHKHTFAVRCRTRDEIASADCGAFPMCTLGRTIFDWLSLGWYKRAIHERLVARVPRTQFPHRMRSLHGERRVCSLRAHRTRLHKANVNGGGGAYSRAPSHIVYTSESSLCTFLVYNMCRVCLLYMNDIANPKKSPCAVRCDRARHIHKCVRDDDDMIRVRALRVGGRCRGRYMVVVVAVVVAVALNRIEHHSAARPM